MAQVRTVALCTTCGRSRTVTISARMIGPERLDAEARCLVDRHCRTCRQITAHAFLRPDEHRDELEGVLATLAGAEDELRAEADAVAADLEALGVRVRRSDSDRVLLLHLLACNTYAVVVGDWPVDDRARRGAAARLPAPARRHRRVANDAR